jgi:hypothetical protein
MSSVAIVLPSKISKDFSTSNTIGTWVQELRIYLSDNKLLSLIDDGLPKSIEALRKKENLKSTFFDVKETTELFDCLWTDVIDNDPKKAAVTRQIALEEFITNTKTNLLKLLSTGDGLSKHRARLSILTDKLTQREESLLTFFFLACFFFIILNLANYGGAN